MIRQTTPQQEIEAYIKERMRRIDVAVLYNLGAIGEQAVTAARASTAYKNQTGNLRSSIGYVIARGGKVVQISGYEQVDGGTLGTKEGEAMARRLAAQFTDQEGYCLIVTAGMDYAAHVANTGRDVLDSAEQTAQRLVNELKQKAQQW